MKYANLANAGVMAQPVYEPGKPIDYVAREFGLDASKIAKLASNENPYGPSPKAVEAGRLAMSNAHIYPDGAASALQDAIAAERGVSSDSIILGNGSNEIIELLGHAFLRPGVEVIMGSQAFIVYKLVTRLFGATAIEVPMKDFAHDLDVMRAAVTERTRMLFVASPNNPTGAANDAEALLKLAETLPEHVIFCLDEAYAEYLEEAPDMRAALTAGRKVFCLRTFSKIYGLGGLRVGYGYGDPKLVRLLQRVRQPFNVNAIAQAAAIAALQDVDFCKMCKSENELGRAFLVSSLEGLGFETFGGSANFVLVRVKDAILCFENLQRQGVIVRPLSAYGMPNYIRITIGTPKENQQLLEAMKNMSESEGNRP